MVLIHVIFLNLLPETKDAPRFTVFDSSAQPRFVSAILAQCVVCILPNPYQICQITCT